MREKTPSDAELVRDARSGSATASRELVRRFERPLLSLIVRMVHDRATAEDLAQESFIKAYESLANLEEREKFGSWLRVIARHTCMDHLRSLKGDVSLETLRSGGMDPAEATRPVDRDVIVEEEEQRVLDALRDLREDYREIIILKHIEELSYKAIAEICDLSVSGVGEKLSRVRQMLKKTLSKKRDGDKKE